MKYVHSTRILLLLAAVLGALITGCSNDPIFSAIETEVKLKEPSVLGKVLSLVAHDGDLYTANGYLLRRTAGDGDWRKMGLPAGASRCSQVAVTEADGTGELFALFQDSSWQFHSLQRYTGSGWEPVTAASRGFSIKNGNGFIYFFREDSMDTSGGATIVSSVHRVSPTGAMTQILSGLTYYKNSGERPIDADGNYVLTNSAVYDSTGLKISNKTDIPVTNLSGLVTNGTDVYAANNGWVYHFDGVSWQSFAHDAKSPLNGLAYLEADGKRMLLLPCGDGYGEVLLDSAGRQELYQDPGRADTSSISTATRSQYKSSIGDWNMLSIFVITNPVPAGNSYCLYAGINHHREDGLWSYYSDTRREWNRE